MADGLKGRNYHFVLYVETESYDIDSVLHDIQSYFNEWAYIVHSHDVFEDTGELKKSHIHVTCRKNSSVLLQTILNRYAKLGVPSNFIELVSSYRAMVRYLTHIDDLDKYQYNFNEIVSNVQDLYRYFNADAEGVSVLKLADLRLEGRSFRQIIEYAVSQGIYDVFRKNYGIISLVVQDDLARRSHFDEDY